MTRDLKFIKLKKEHFPLIHKWLETPHVWEWWGENKKWSPQDIDEKYLSYTQGYKLNHLNEKKPIYSFIIEFQGRPLGYIQYYNALDFLRENFDINAVKEDFSEPLAALDFYVGEVELGLGSEILTRFLQDYIFTDFTACLVDPAKNNKFAIRAYAKAGFSTHRESEMGILMIARKAPEVSPIIIVGSSCQDGGVFKAAKLVIQDQNVPIIDLNKFNVSYYDYEHRNEKDDFLPLAELMIKHNPILLATPVYWYTMSAQMKTFIDRWSDLLELRKDIGRRLAGKDLYLIASYAGELPRAFEEPFAQMSQYLEMNYLGCFYYYSGEDPQRLAKNASLADQFSQKIFRNHSEKAK
jgi:aminoglycoside 6'-N-acetyltransferase